MGGENTKETQKEEKKGENNQSKNSKKENNNSEESDDEEEEEEEDDDDDDDEDEDDSKNKTKKNKNSEKKSQSKIKEGKSNNESLEKKSQGKGTEKKSQSNGTEKKSQSKDTEKKSESNGTEIKSQSKKVEKKNKNSKKVQKKEERYFSIQESISSEIQSSNKNIINNKNISELSSYIDQRKFNSNTSLNFTIQSKNSKNNNKNSISEESFDPNFPKVDNRYHQKGENKYFGDFNTLDKDLVYKKKKKKEESEDSEIEEDMTLPLKERVYNECNRHKYYLDTNEKGAFAKINKKSLSNPPRYKYRKSVLLHKKEITCLISLSGTIKKIAYASSSHDKTIILWDSYFLIISEIKCEEWYSNFICEFDTTNILSCESNHIKMYNLISEHYDCIKVFKDHIEDINCLLPVIDYEEEKYIFLSGGKDKTLRLWDHEMDAPIKYYEGHYSTVTQIQKYGNDNKKFISCSDDKTFIVWDIKNSNPLKIFNNYFNHLYILGDNYGFCCGAYDNKIRFYNEEYLLTKCIVSKLYGIRYILMINNYCMLIVDINNNMNILDLDETENNLAFIYTGYEDEIVNVIKSFNWNSENSGSRAIMVACKNGYVYQYSFEYELKDENKSSKSKKKKHKSNRKK